MPRLRHLMAGIVLVGAVAPLTAQDEALPTVAETGEPTAPPPPDWSKPFLEPDAVILHEWRGEHANDQFGWVAEDAGDVNGDGVNDVITSAPFWQVDGKPAGRVYLYSGKSGALLASHDGAPGDLLGMAVSGIGDVDGDGFADYAAGAPQPRTGAGEVKVWSGKTHALLGSFDGDQPGDSFGRELAGCGDFDRDGTPDLLIAAPGFAGGAGRVHRISGAGGDRVDHFDGGPGETLGSVVAGDFDGEHPLMVLGAMNAGEGQRGEVRVYRGLTPELHFTLQAREHNVNLGRFFASVFGDCNGDGVPDVYCVDFESNAGGAGSGEAVVASGEDGAVLHRFVGAAGEGLGIGNAVAGDYDGDGAADLVIGAWTNSEQAPSAGKVYLRSGRNGAVLRTWTCVNANDTFGFDATVLGDVDDDGRPDYLFTSAWSGANGVRSGRVFVMSGAD